MLETIFITHLISLVESWACNRLTDGSHQATSLVGKFGFSMLNLHREISNKWGRGYLTYIQRESIALQKHLQVRIFAQNRVVRNFLNALLQRETSLSDELIVKPPKRVLLRYRWHHHARVVSGKSLVEP